MSIKNELAGIIANDLNTKFKDQKIAYFLDGDDLSPTDVSGWISTGSSILDLAISNRPNGGFGIGKISELNGLEGSGKSLIGAHALASTQKQNGVAVYIDTESAVSRDFLKAIGVDVSKMLYIHPDSLEDIYEIVEEIITSIRSSDKDKLVTILIDSVSAIPTRAELSGDFDKEGWATDKAIITSKALRKLTQMIGEQRIAVIFTQQLRTRLGVSFGDKYTTSGGLSLPYHASTRIRLKKMGQIKDKSGNVIGISLRGQVIKNRLGPPLRHADFDLFFHSGIDDDGGWLKFLKEHKLVKTGGAWSTLEVVDKETGEVEEIKFQAKDWSKKLKDEKLRKYVYDLICDTSILQYEKKLDETDINMLDNDGD